MNSTSMTLIALASTAATSASAQSTQYLSYGAEYTNLDVNGNEFNVIGLSAGIDYKNSSFIFNGGLSYTDPDLDDQVTDLSIRAGYEVAPGAIIYGGINHSDFDSGSDTYYNIGAEYAINGFTVGLNIGQFDEDDADTFTTVYASYMATPNLEVGLAYTSGGEDGATILAAEYDMGDTDLDVLYTIEDGIYIFGMGGTYDFGNGYRALVDYATLDGDVDVYAIGGGYEVTDNMWIDLTVGSIDFDDGNSGDMIGLAFTVETGRETLLIDRNETMQRNALGFLGTALTGGGI